MFKHFHIFGSTVITNTCAKMEAISILEGKTHKMGKIRAQLHFDPPFLMETI